MTISNDKQKKLRNVLNKFNKDGEVVNFGSDLLSRYKYYSTQFQPLNKLIKGIPLGRVTIVAGPASVGKTALMWQIIAYRQQCNEDFIALWMDFENSFDSKWAETLGVDLNRIVVIQYNDEITNMESAFDKALSLIKEKVIDFMVVDSIGAMLPKGDVESKKGDRSLEDNNMLNLQVKLGEIFRKMNTVIMPRDNWNGCAVMMLGHVYDVPTTTGVPLKEVRGGNSVKHWAYLRLMLRRSPKNEWPTEIEKVSYDGRKIKYRPGFCTRIKLEKTKTNENEGQEIAINFYNGRGFDWKESTISAALAMEIISRTGGWYICELFPEGKVQGKPAVFKHFEDNEEDYKKLCQLIDNNFLIKEEDDE